MPLANCNLKKFISLNQNTETNQEALDLFQLYETKRDKEEASTDRDEKMLLLNERIKLISDINSYNAFINNGLLCIFMDTYKVRILETASEKLNFSNLQDFILTYNTIKAVEKEKGKVSRKIQTAIFETQQKMISAAAKTDFATQALKWIVVNDTSKELVFYAKQQAINNNVQLILPWCLNSMILKETEK